MRVLRRTSLCGTPSSTRATRGGTRTKLLSQGISAPPSSSRRHCSANRKRMQVGLTSLSLHDQNDKTSTIDMMDVRPSVMYGVPIVLALILYLNTIPAGFVYDDHRAIVNNPDVTGSAPISSVWLHDFWGAPLQRKGSHGSWRPLTTLSFRLNAFLASGNDHQKQQQQPDVALQSLLPNTSWHFHTTNILLHVAVTGAYVGMLQSVGVHKAACLWAGALFAAHPVHVEAVGGVVGRAELLAGFTFCLAIGAYAFYIRGRIRRGCTLVSTPGTVVCPCLSMKAVSQYQEEEELSLRTGRNVLWLWASVGATALGIMCKEQAVTALGVAFVLHAALLVSTTSLRKSLFKALVCETWLISLLTGFLIWCRLSLSPSVPSFTAADNPAAHASSPLTRALSVGRYWVLHARLLLLPDVLSFDWSMGAVPLVSSPIDREVIPVVLLLFGCGYLARATMKSLLKQRSSISTCKARVFHDTCHDFLNNNNNNNFEDGMPPPSSPLFLDKRGDDNPLALHEPAHIAFALGLLVVPFLPASNLMAWVGFVAAERVLYLPSMGAALLVALGAHRLSIRLIESIPSTTKTNSRSSNHRKLGRRRERSRKILGVINIIWLVLILLMGSRTLKRNGDWFSDETLYKSGIKVCPAKALANLGVVYSDQGRVDEAERAYRSALQHAPHMADTHYNLGLLLSRTNRRQEAILSFKEALSSRPWLAQAHLALASTLMQTGQDQEAEMVLENCLKHAHAPAKDGMSHSWAVTNCQQRLSRIRVQNGQPNAAIDELQRALQTAPPGYPAHALLTLLAEAHVSAGEHAEAQEALSKALKVQPSHVPAHLAFSRLLQANGSKIGEAETWLRRAVALAPDDALAHKHLGQLLLEQGQAEAAVDPWLRSATLDPSDHTAAFNSATALRLAGRNHHAEIFYRKAVQLLPQDVASQRNLGAILHLNGKLEEARFHYNMALTMAPGDHQTTTNLRRLEALLKKKGPL